MNTLIITIKVRVESVRDIEIEGIRKELLRALCQETNHTIIRRASRSVTEEITSLKWEKT